MANFTGNDGEVYIGAAKVAEMLDYTITEGVATFDNSAVDDAADTHLVGSTNWSGSVSCWWDDTDATGQELMVVGASLTVNFRPEGTGVGSAQSSGTGTIESIEEGLSRNNTNTRNFTIKGNGALDRTVQ